MIPKLYSPTVLTSAGNTDLPQDNGYGLLNETISCRVTEDLQGVFELELEYPIYGYLSDYIIDNAMISVDCGKGLPQFFRIYRIEKTTDKILRVSAQHNSYRLLWEMVKPISTLQTQVIDAVVMRIKSALYESTRFIMTGYGETEMYFFDTSTSASVKSLLMRVCDDLDLDFIINDNFEVQISTKRTLNTTGDPRIMSGKNLIYFSEELNNEDVVTGYAPYLTIDGETMTYGLFLKPDVPARMQRPVPFNMRDVEFGANDAWPDVGMVEQYFTGLVNGMDISPRRTVSAKYIDLAIPYRLRDGIQVSVPQLKYEGTLRIVKRVYDVLRERNESIEIGDPRKDLVTFLARDFASSIYVDTTDYVSSTYMGG